MTSVDEKPQAVGAVREAKQKMETADDSTQ